MAKEDRGQLLDDPLDRAARGLMAGTRGGRDLLDAARHGTMSTATGRPSELRFLTVAELRARTPTAPPWLWEGYLAAGAVTLLVGKPKAGKSTLALALAAAMGIGAATFLDRAIVGGPVLYVSEESGATLMHKLPGDDDAALHLLTRDEAWPKPEWPQLVAACVAHAEKVAARLLVIDTATFWTALPAEREKDAGAVQAATLPLVHATRAGLAVLYVHQTRKAGGEDGDAVRGSSGWAASVDTILELERPGDNAPPTQRLLLGLGRYPSTPPCALIDHDPQTGSWTVSGHAEDRRSARVATVRAAVLDALASGDSLTRPELEEITGTAWRDLLDVVKGLVSAKLVTREGAGRKGEPYRYREAVGKPGTQKPAVPTESAGGGASDSVVCPVGTPQNQAPPPSIAAALAPTETDADLPIATDAEQYAYERALVLIGETVA
jgi:hypothetical protein